MFSKTPTTSVALLAAAPIVLSQTCDMGSLQCCNTVLLASDPSAALLLGLLGIVLPSLKLGYPCWDHLLAYISDPGRLGERLVSSALCYRLLSRSRIEVLSSAHCYSAGEPVCCLNNVGEPTQHHVSAQVYERSTDLMAAGGLISIDCTPATS